MTSSDKFDPRWKESPDLPGEIYEDHAICAWCHENIPVGEAVNSTVSEDAFHFHCAEHLESMWALQAETEADELHD